MIGQAGAAAITLVLVVIVARAEPVYRCGNAYQDKPCPGATIIDAEPNKGMEVRTSSGAVVRSPDGDKGRTARAMELGRENMHNGIVCGLATETAAVANGRFDCPTARAQQEAKRLTPDYIRK